MYISNWTKNLGKCMLQFCCFLEGPHTALISLSKLRYKFTPLIQFVLSSHDSHGQHIGPPKPACVYIATQWWEVLLLCSTWNRYSLAGRNGSEVLLAQLPTAPIIPTMLPPPSHCVVCALDLGIRSSNDVEWWQTARAAVVHMITVGSTIPCHDCECSNTSDTRSKYYSSSSVCLACEQLGDVDYAYLRRSV